jgi:indolepyruvate ferredoxin oxidoreductase beta subunit
MSEVKNILLVGVGGQGTILAAKLLTMGLMQAGYDVKMSEIHGMSQRGGSVSSQVRYGDHVLSPVIEIGGADILVSFEKMEALRWLEYLKIGGRVIVNDAQILPTSVLMGTTNYPEGILEELAAHADTVVFDAVHEAAKLGNERVMNVLLLGTTVKTMGLESIDWEKVIRETVKPEFVDINLRAFARGIKLAE